MQDIDELGLTKLDRRVLEYLGEVIRTLGLSSISKAFGEDTGTIENFVEPWLLKLRLIVRTSSGETDNRTWSEAHGADSLPGNEASWIDL